MTVVQPNSIAGINSISVESGQSLSIHKSDGTLIREIVASTGISTFSSISVGSASTANNAAKSINIGLGASISQHTDNSLSFGTNGVPRLLINSSGLIQQYGFTGTANAAANDLALGNTTGSVDRGMTVWSNSSQNGTIAFADNDSNFRGAVQYRHSGDHLRFLTSGTERIRITGGGVVGVGTDLPVTESGWGNALHVHTAASGAHVRFSDGTSKGTASDGSLVGHYTNDLYLINKESTGSLIINTNGNERTRVDSSGRLLIASDTSRSIWGANPQLQIEKLDSNAALSIIRHSNSAAGPWLALCKSRGTSNGAVTIVQDGDSLGSIDWFGADGADLANTSAEIRAEIDGTPGNNDLPGRIIFKTTADGAASPTERLRITSDGQIGVNKSSPKAWNASYTSLQIHDAGYIAGSTDDSFVALGANNYLDTGGTYDYTNSDFASQLYQVDGTLVFRNAPSGTADNAITWTNRLSINVSGNATFAGTVSDSKGDLRRVIENEPGGGAYQIVAADAGKFIHHNNTIKMPDSGTLSIGDMVTIYAYGALTLDVTKPGGGEATVYNAADASTGDRTFAARSIATILCVAADTYVISGAGIS